MPEEEPLPTPSRLLELIDAMAGQPVAMVADLVADRFITGTPKRISREAPVLILRFESETLTLGGGGNAVANVAALDGQPLPLGVVGDDESGRRLLAALAERGIPTEGILVRTDYHTPTKTRILGGARHAIKQQIVRYDVEDELRLAPEERRHFLQCLEKWSGRIAVLSDYGYGAVAPDLLPEIRHAVGKEGMILCDSRFRLGEFQGLDAATPNEEEAEILLGSSFDDDLRRVEEGGRHLLARLAARFLLITRGSRGMSLFSRDHPTAHIPVHGTDQVADVTGAGDTVMGTFALALAAGATALEAALLANYAGGVVVMKLGTATLSREELRQAVETDPRPIQELRWESS